ncbi:MAG: metallophosphoesterase [Campylobacteraceae bacterium]|nr:metallophosphoesterase [Campylobacteraceae bacterium]
MALIDILSDTHFDNWFGYPHQGNKNKLSPPKDAIVGFWRKLKPQGDYLILAGDIGHSIEQNINILKILKELYYKEIILTMGNHDYYVADSEYKSLFENGIEKATEAKMRYQDAGMIVLDGTIEEIEGIKFGGAMGWYHSAYVHKNQKLLREMQSAHYFPSLEAFLQELWGDCINDKRYTKLDVFDELFEEEYAKLKAVHQACDVMVTHYSPSIAFEHQNMSYARNPSTSFFCFDGEDLVKNMSGKLWIFGHTHESKSTSWHNKEIITNALGYSHEWSNPNQIVTKEIIIDKNLKVKIR